MTAHIIITVVAIILLLIHQFVRELDAATIFLLGIAALPWLMRS